jgi:hypothetical protein
MAKRGRPEKKIDIEQVRKLAEVGCTDEEIAWIMDIATSTLALRKQRKEFSDTIKKARANLNMSVRRAQVVHGLKGNATLLIWLGKQLLGQRDRAEVSLEVSDDQIQRELDRLRAEEKKERAAIEAKKVEAIQ